MSWEKLESGLLRFFSLAFWWACAGIAFVLLARVAVLLALPVAALLMLTGIYAVFGRSGFARYARAPGYLAVVVLQLLS